MASACGPLTLTRPKPLVEVAGKALIDYGFDRLRAAGVETRRRQRPLSGRSRSRPGPRARPRPRIIISDERGEILDTGGGVAQALPLLGDDPFFVINSDSFWIDEGEPALDRLRAAWDDAAMDCLLLLCPLDRTVGYDGTGDFVRGADGRLAAARRRRRANRSPISAAISSRPACLPARPQGKFSMNLLWDRAIAQGPAVRHRASRPLASCRNAGGHCRLPKPRSKA